MSTVPAAVTSATPQLKSPGLAPPAAETRPTSPGRCVTFSLVGDADPGTLPRVLELVAKRGLVPFSFTSRVVGDRMEMAMEVIGMAHAESNHVANCLRQIPTVAEVTMSDRTVTFELLAAE